MKKKTMGAKPFLLPMTTVLAGANREGKANYMPVSFCGIIQQSPALIAISVGPTHYTNKAIKDSQGFSINIPSSDMVEVTDYCGLISGINHDKSELFENFYGKLEDIPMIKECRLNLECKLVNSIDLGGTHELFIGEILESYIDEDCITNNLPDIKKIDPITYSVGSNEYWKVGEYIGKAWGAGKNYEVVKK